MKIEPLIGNEWDSSGFFGICWVTHKNAKWGRYGFHVGPFYAYLTIYFDGYIDED